MPNATPYRYSTTRALLSNIFQGKRRSISGLGMAQPGSFNSGSLGTTLSMSNDMMMGMAVGAVVFVLMKKKGALPK